MISSTDAKYIVHPNIKYYEVAVREFMTVFEQPFYKHVDEAPIELHKLRARLILEELEEYYAAKERGTEELDALCDLMYVVVGTMLSYAIPIRPYTSCQLRLPKWTKHDIFARPVLNELHSCFPCQNIMLAEGNTLISRIEDVGYLQGYNIRGAFEAVHQNNLDKLWPIPSLNPDHSCVAKNVDGATVWLVKDKGGKVVKPDYHTKVDLSPYV